MNYLIDTDGYVLIFLPDHPRAYKSGPLRGYVAEHIVVAEKMMQRQLTERERVHHLDRDKTNNAHTNLLVLENSQHSKLHSWMNKHFIVRKPEIYNTFLKRFSKYDRDDHQNVCNRCATCNLPIKTTQTYCSPECTAIGHRKLERPDADALGRDIVSMPMTKVGEKYGVSDNAIRKWCRALGIPCKLHEIK